MADAKEGDKVKVITKDETVEGILMPNKETDSVVIKLDSGYNVGFDRKNVKKIEVVEKAKAAKEKKGGEVKMNKKLPTIAILHTGGTIASKVDYKTGGVVARFSPEDLLEMFPELEKIANIRSKLISNMFSEDMRFKHYSIIAKAVEEEVKKGCDGVIITHGTDTMCYSSAALAFMLEDLPVPVILVGAQRSSDRGSSDAGMNLIDAAHFIAKTDFAGVAICMHETSEDISCDIFPATKTRKLHSSRRDAFKAVNALPIARVKKDKSIQFLTRNYPKKSDSKLEVHPNLEEKVAILRVHPNMVPEQFEFYKSYKGLIIEGTGLGQAPVGVPNEYCEIHKKNLEAIRNLVKNGTVVVMTTQTIFGRVHMHVYSNAIMLENAGVVPGEDMLTETAFVKLAWLLANHPKEAKELMRKNLRGEITERSEFEEDFLKCGQFSK